VCCATDRRAVGRVDYVIHTTIRRKVEAIPNVLVRTARARAALSERWRIYAYEAAGLGGFLFVVGVVDSMVFAPQSPLDSIVSSEALKRLIVGIAAGLYLIALVYSRWGKESGAHINPSITLAFLRLRKIRAFDAGFYIGAQFVGAVLGVAFYKAVMGSWASDPEVNFIVTVPGKWGWWPAFVAEFGITFSMMLLVLESASSERYRRFTGVFCAVWLAILILIESPISGTSLNPARSTGSDVIAIEWNNLLLYFIAPPLGAQLAVLAFRWSDRARQVPCAKLNHHPLDHPGTLRCIMKDCHHRQAAMQVQSSAASA
jgi:aquaporin Z